MLSGIYNIGSGKANTFKEIAELVQKKFLGSEIEYIEMPETMRSSYQSYTEANINKLMNTFPNMKFHMFKEAIQIYLDYLDEQKMRFS